MKLIVGLGNPGTKYKNNRHNLGFMVIDRIAGEFKVKLNKSRFNSLFGEKKNLSMLLAKPMTFMNDSGEAVRALVDWYKIDIKDILIICDDFNLDLGKLRIRKAGSSGGHKGLESIIACLGSNQFSRLRLGIGRPVTVVDMTEYVLENFSGDEEESVREMIGIACEAVKVFINQDIIEAMNKYNAPSV